ncbi:unnamed protein product [Ixodes pacificus]
MDMYMPHVPRDSSNFKNTSSRGLRTSVEKNKQKNNTCPTICTSTKQARFPLTSSFLLFIALGKRPPTAYYEDNEPRSHPNVLRRNFVTGASLNAKVFENPREKRHQQ